MNEVIEYEFETFKEEIADKSFIFGKYLDESDYEDEYCHNDIDEAKELLVEKIREYLRQTRPSEFIVSDGYCVFVMTPQRARESRISESTIENSLVS